MNTQVTDRAPENTQDSIPNTIPEIFKGIAESLAEDLDKMAKDGNTDEAVALVYINHKITVVLADCGMDTRDIIMLKTAGSFLDSPMIPGSGTPGYSIPFIPYPAVTGALSELIGHARKLEMIEPIALSGDSNKRTAALMGSLLYLVAEQVDALGITADEALGRYVAFLKSRREKGLAVITEEHPQA